MKYTALAEEIVQKIGGKENITSVTNCVTRLRFVLKDDSIPVIDEVKKISGVLGVVCQGGQFQVIIGTHVPEVIPEIRKAAGIIEGKKEEVEESKEVSTSNDKKIEKKQTDKLFNRFFKMISGCIFPAIGPMIGGGIIKGILAVCIGFGLLESTDGTYLILYAAANALFYFFPIIIGFSAAKVFDCNPYVAACIGGALVYPDIMAITAAQESLSFLAIPVSLATYTNTVFPIIAAIWFASKVEKLTKKLTPSVLQMVLVPAFTLAISVPVTYLAIGPVMNFLSEGLSSVVMGTFALCPAVAGAILGAFWQLLVVLGLHNAFIPVFINDILTNGFCPVDACVGLSIFAMAGMALGYALKTKNKEDKAVGFSASVSAFCGVTEPAIYTIALPKFKNFVCAFIGGGVGGAIMALFGGKTFGFGSGGIFNGPYFINPNGIDSNFYLWLACAAITCVVTAVLSYIVTDAKKK